MLNKKREQPEDRSALCKKEGGVARMLRGNVNKERAIYLFIYLFIGSSPILRLIDAIIFNNCVMVSSCRSTLFTNF